MKKENIKKTVVPGNKIKLNYGKGNINNKTMHIRAIVDETEIVFCVWSRRYKRFSYRIDSIIGFESMADYLSLSGKSNF